jgi:hypothetical protein
MIQMRQINLASAAVEIRQALDQSKKRGSPSPFFFMVGAGISHPPLPLAAKIQEVRDRSLEMVNLGS